MASSTVFSTIQPSHLPNAIVVQLRRAIVLGKLHPGEHLAEVSIAQQLGVSRGPVRDALRILEREGLVVNLPNRGSFVRRFTTQDVDEIFSLRMAIEILAARRVVDKLTEADLGELEHLRQAHEQAFVADNGARPYEADLDFHEYICRRSGHSRLMAVWEGIRSQCLALFHLRQQYSSAYPSLASTSLRDHKAFVDAFSRRDLAQIIALHTEINERVARQLQEVLIEADIRG